MIDPELSRFFSTVCQFAFRGVFMATADLLPPGKVISGEGYLMMDAKQGNRMNRFSPLPLGEGPGERGKHRCIHRLKSTPQPLTQREKGFNISRMNGKNGSHAIALMLMMT